MIHVLGSYPSTLCDQTVAEVAATDYETWRAGEWDDVIEWCPDCVAAAGGVTSEERHRLTMLPTEVRSDTIEGAPS